MPPAARCPLEYAGFALATLCAGLMLPFAPQFAARSWGIGLAGGMFAGVALAGCVLGPMLRKTGAFSLSGVLATRFPSLPPRLGVIALACVSSELVALAGQQMAVDVLSGMWGGGRASPPPAWRSRSRHRGTWGAARLDLDGLRGGRGCLARLRLARAEPRAASLPAFHGRRQRELGRGRSEAAAMGKPPAGA